MRVRRKSSVVFSLGVLVLACTEKGKTEPPAPPSLPTSVSEPCAAVDDHDLEATVKCFYGLKKYSGTYRFITEDAKKEITQKQWESGDGPCPCEAKVLGTNTKNGSMLARVSITVSAMPQRADAGFKCSSTWTRTWTQEQGRWRLVRQPKLKETADKQMFAGDFQAAAESYAKLLEKDPFSVEAYSGLATAIGDRGARLPGKSLPDLVRGVLSVNPVDSVAASAAATHTTDSAVAGMFMDKLSSSDCLYRNAVFNVALKQPSPRLILEFLDGHSPKFDAPELTLVRVAALTDLKKREDLRVLLTPTVLGNLRGVLEDMDPSFAAGWAVDLARALLLLGDVPTATEFVESGLSRNPESKALRDVFRRLPKKTK